MQFLADLLNLYKRTIIQNLIRESRKVIQN